MKISEKNFFKSRGRGKEHLSYCCCFKDPSTFPILSEEVTLSSLERRPALNAPCVNVLLPVFHTASPLPDKAASGR